MPRTHTPTGTRFGHLTITSANPKKLDGRKISYLCRCDCGTELYIRANLLQQGRSKSCGCQKAILRKEAIKNNACNTQSHNDTQ